MPTTVMPHNHDVLCGRGGKTLRHAGNYAFRSLVFQNKVLNNLLKLLIFIDIIIISLYCLIQVFYAQSDKFDKIQIAKEVVNIIKQQSPPGRFLKYDTNKNIWIEVDDKAAIDKASQALREKKSVIKPMNLSNSNAQNIERDFSPMTISSESKIPNLVEISRVDTRYDVQSKHLNSAVIPDDKEIDYLIYQTFCLPSKVAYVDGDDDMNMSSAIDAQSNESLKTKSFSVRCNLPCISNGKEERYLSHKNKKSIHYDDVRTNYFDVEIQLAKKKARIFKAIRSKAA